eukprot:354917-Chlamydomonas_euryale.AAC.22
MRTTACSDAPLHSPILSFILTLRSYPLERVRQAGGQVYNWNGHRVMGVLAMSRAIGDHALRPYVIPEPEVRCCPHTPAPAAIACTQLLGQSTERGLLCPYMWHVADFTR